jgi:membrane protease YdiL (CAAX protease family)
MKNRFINIFKIQFIVTKDTIIAFLLGSLVIATSALLLLFGFDTKSERMCFYVLRDFFMIFVLGFAVPLYYILIVKKERLSLIGITRRKWFINIVIGLILAVLLAFQFINESGTKVQIVFSNAKVLGPIVYLMLVAGVFEIIFFYGFMRQMFEEAFGIIPGILLTALFYSFHHVGFQPEFLKLFWVGIIMASLFRLTNSALIIYPFFWGVGACWDVLVQSQVKGIENIYLDIWQRTIIIFSMMIMFSVFLFWKSRKKT